MCEEEQYPSTQEFLCDTLAEGSEERYISEVIPWLHKDAFGRVFLTLLDSKVWKSFILPSFFDWKDPVRM